MIPSSPRRTWRFLLLSCLAFWGPDLVVPEAWSKNETYLLLSTLYQEALVVAGFWYGPAICRTLVVREVSEGPLRQAVDWTLAELHRPRGSATRLAEIPVTLADHPGPFIVTAGLLPRQSRIFLSSGLTARLGIHGLRFLLARALVHAHPSQRLAALLPLLMLTLVLSDVPEGVMAWLSLFGFLAGWLVLHWAFELLADRKAARTVGAGATAGLLEVLAATATPGNGLSVRPPLRWRLRVMGSISSSNEA
jgi:hypothetical protein